MNDGLHWEPSEGDVVSGQASDYELLEYVDTGGFSTVFRARNLDSGEIVGLKYPNYSSPNPNYEAFIQREVKALRTLQSLGGHPNVMSLREYFVEDGTDFLIVDFIEGDVVENISFDGDAADVRRIGLRVSAALAVFHWNDLVYRDLKDSNIILTPDENPVLIDLNAVRTLPRCPSCKWVISHDHANDTHCPECGADMGPVTRISNANRGHYRAPEQTDSAVAPGPWTDVYGVGKLLFRLLTGFKSLDDHIDPRDYVNCPDYMAEIVQTATASKSSHRYESAAELGRALWEQSVTPGTPTAIVTDVDTGEQYEIRSGDSIGRKREPPSATIEIHDPRDVISREHVTFKHNGYRWIINDRSLNGTVLHHGDEWFRLMSERAVERRPKTEFRPPSQRAVSVGDRVVPIEPDYEKQFRFEGPDWTNI